jgi:propionyl-CoA carboxylase alpha chain
MMMMTQIRKSCTRIVTNAAAKYTFPSITSRTTPFRQFSSIMGTGTSTGTTTSIGTSTVTTPSTTVSQHKQLKFNSNSFSTSPSTQSAPSTQSTPPTPPFQKILIANRGEIARRIIQTCHKLNIKTVAIYSTSDSKSPHVQEATESICVGPTNSSESYLHIDNIKYAIQKSGADAVHPGYGFLSENAEFSSLFYDDHNENGKNGVAFIGPSPNAISAMGDKITSKQIAQDANVNIIPGYDGFVTSPQHAIQVANDIGYPIMIKATSGGGGKGMRICYNDDQVQEGFGLSSAEAKSFFNDDRLFIEKFIENPHHIEIQLLAGYKNSKDGNNKELEILCFPERECSIQRRNQKILEESPSTLLTPETRAEMIRQVKSLVRKVGYTSAGTVEFLVDEHQHFYFLEMNTRLQVEHPVTEMVSGDVDLVHGMIDIAAGRGIPQEYLDLVRNAHDYDSLTDDEIDGLAVPHKGHAIEARIYAEDPTRGFLPSTGPLLQYIEPPSTIPSNGETEEGNNNECRIRVDSGVLPGSIISQYYDPMISKLIAYSSNNRTEAIDALKGALDRYVIKGIEQNSSFILDVLRKKEFIEGKTPTNFIDLHYPDGFNGVELDSSERAELVAVVAGLNSWMRERHYSPPLALNDISTNGGEELIVCIGGMFGSASVVDIIEEGKIIVKHLVQNSNDEEEGDVTESSTPHEIIIDYMEYDTMSPIIDVVINGVKKAIQIQNEDNTGVFNVQYSGANFDCLVMGAEEYKLSRFMKEPKVLDTSNLLLSPMPGTLVSYAVEEGDKIVDGQEICVVEAMKMQNVLRSTRSGVIKKCYVETGSSLMTDEMIVEFEYEEDNDCNL